MNNKDFVRNFKKLNSKQPEGVSKYENNFLNDEDDNKSDTELELESDNDDDCENFGSEENIGYTESDTDVSSVCSEHSDTEEDVVRVKNKFFKPKLVQSTKFTLLQEESDFEEEI